jgi:peptide/nickel transport system substrate-binding protein
MQPGQKRGSEDQALGRSRGGLSTKIHLAVRGLGIPVRFLLTGGQRGDCPQAHALIDGLPADFVMADTAYDADRLRKAITDKGAVAVIPNNPSRARKYPIDRHLYLPAPRGTWQPPCSGDEGILVRSTRRAIITLVVTQLRNKSMISRRDLLAAGTGVTLSGLTIPAIATTPAHAQARGGVINVAVIGEAPTLDPMMSTTDLVGTLTQHIYETLFTFDASWKVVPLLAAGMPSMSQGGRVYEIPLREGVRFHDGSPMGAKDVVASIKRWLNLASRGRTTADNVVGIEAVSPTRVRIELKAPYAPLLALLAFSNSAAVIMPEGKQDNPLKEVIGTGPYKLKDRQPDRYLQLVRFDNYASPPGEPSGYAGARHAWFDEIRFVPVPDANTRIEAALAGQYDFVDSLPVEALPRLQGKVNVAPILLKSFGWPSLNFNLRKGLAANKAFRQGISAIFSMQDMLAAAFGSTDYYTLEGALYPPGYVWYTAAGVKESYNLANAKLGEKLLKEAKYDGSPFRILTSQQYEFHYKIAQVGAEYLKAAGVKVDMQVVDWATLTQRRANPDLWDMFITHSPFLPEPALIFQLDSSAPPGWDTPAHTRVLGAFNSELDADKRVAQWADVQKLIFDEVPYIKVGDYSALAARSPKLQGTPAVPWPFFWNAYRG